MAERVRFFAPTTSPPSWPARRVAGAGGRRPGLGAPARARAGAGRAGRVGPRRPGAVAVRALAAHAGHVPPRRLEDGQPRQPSRRPHGPARLGLPGRRAGVPRAGLVPGAQPGPPAGDEGGARSTRCRAALERHGVDTDGWWDAPARAVPARRMVQFGWEKALGDDDELGWWGEPPWRAAVAPTRMVTSCRGPVRRRGGGVRPRLPWRGGSCWTTGAGTGAATGPLARPRSPGRGARCFLRHAPVGGGAPATRGGGRLPRAPAGRRLRRRRCVAAFVSTVCPIRAEIAELARVLRPGRCGARGRVLRRSAVAAARPRRRGRDVCAAGGHPRVVPPAEDDDVPLLGPHARWGGARRRGSGLGEVQAEWGNWTSASTAPSNWSPTDSVRHRSAVG